MDEIYRERLIQLRRVVEVAPDDLLHMHSITDEARCGTAHCAWGWASVDPWFRENTSIVETDPFERNIFGLSVREASKLFGGELGSHTPDHAVTKAEVLWNIDAILAGAEPRHYAATGDESLKPFVPRPVKAP